MIGAHAPSDLLIGTPSKKHDFVGKWTIKSSILWNTVVYEISKVCINSQVAQIQFVYLLEQIAIFFMSLPLPLSGVDILEVEVLSSGSVAKPSFVVTSAVLSGSLGRSLGTTLWVSSGCATSGKHGG